MTDKIVSFIIGIIMLAGILCIFAGGYITAQYLDKYNTVTGASTVVNTNRQASYTATTVNASTSTLTTISLSASSTIHIFAHIIANNPTSTSGGGWYCAANFKRQNTDITRLSDICLGGVSEATWGVAFTTTSGGIQVNVNGAAGQNIYWSSYIESYP